MIVNTTTVEQSSVVRVTFADVSITWERSTVHNVCIKSNDLLFARGYGRHRRPPKRET